MFSSLSVGENLSNIAWVYSLFRTISLHVPITSMVFSAEGAALYVGTETGKLYVLDLRALDKPAKPITISAAGSKIICMSVQVHKHPSQLLLWLIKSYFIRMTEKTQAR